MFRFKNRIQTCRIKFELGVASLKFLSCCDYAALCNLTSVSCALISRFSCLMSRRSRL